MWRERGEDECFFLGESLTCSPTGRGSLAVLGSMSFES